MSESGRGGSSRHWQSPMPRDAATFSIVDGRENPYNSINRSNSINSNNMGSEKYKLKWSKYESNVLNAFRDLFETEALSDVTLFCEGQIFKAHRLVLSACSTHFQTLFSHTPINAPINNQLYVILDGTRADDLQILLHFMYRGEAYLHQDRINSVLRTAEVLQVKGLSEGPRSLEVNDQLQPPLQRWSPPPQQQPLPQQQSPSPHHRGSVGIMGSMKRKAEVQHHHPQHHPQQQQHHSHHSRERDSREHIRMMSPPPPASLPPPSSLPPHVRSVSPSEHYPYPSSSRDAFGVYGSAFRGLGHYGGSSRGSGDPRAASYSPSRDAAPGRSSSTGGAGIKSSCSSPAAPRAPSGSMYGVHLSKEEPVDRDDPYDIVRSTSGGGRPEPMLDRHTPSDKSDRHYDRRSGGGCDRSSSRGSPPSPAPTPGSVSSMGKSTPVGGVGGVFPSDSTTADRESGNGIGIRGSYKESPSRMRRPSEDLEPPISSKHYIDYRGSRDDLIRMRNSNNSPPVDGRSNSVSDLRMSNNSNNDDNARSQAANSLDAFRRIAQAQAAAQAERDRFLPTAAGVHLSGINAATLAAQQGGLAGSASDYMRLAMPVRDPDNGDAISGSGTKLRCPFCERTYGYETNLRAHIRQRHQGIRVSCPYCPRTFTRNNTVRRHVQREHRNLPGRIPTKFNPTRVMPREVNGSSQHVLLPTRKNLSSNIDQAKILF